MERNLFAENLKNIRKKCNYSIDEFAKILEIPARTIGGYERGERNCSIEILAQMCKKLNVNANWFLTGEGEMFNNSAREFEQVEDEFAQKVEVILKKKGLI